MKVLAYDTSTCYLSIACVDDGKEVASFHRDMGVSHSDFLIPEIDSLIRSAGWRKEDLDLVCAGTGPGSFTGLRIGIAALKAFSFLPETDVIGIPSMDAIAARSPVREGRVAPLLDARKNKVYFCAYELAQGKPVRITEYMLGNIKEVLEGIDEDVIFLGDGVDKYINELKGAGKARYIPDADWYPRAGYLAEAALELYEQEGKGQDPETVEPLYLHPRDCNITGKNKNGRKV